MAKMTITLTSDEIMDIIIQHYSDKGYDVESFKIQGNTYGFKGTIYIKEEN